MEPADWIGVVLIVVGLGLVVSAFVVRKSRKGNQGGIEGNLHPSLARELDEDGPISVTTNTETETEDNQQTAQHLPVADEVTVTEPGRGAAP